MQFLLADSIVNQRCDGIDDLVNYSSRLAQIRPVIPIGKSLRANANSAKLAVFTCVLGVLARCWSLSFFPTRLL